ncbi:MAG TPA: ABC-type transport auxiliary lipoprotein family protein [Burkholderiaceae bacterium]|nr:ABC-type transport auxiliary lipoprotein family protein [Burkholderiaceae bacterium]
MTHFHRIARLGPRVIAAITLAVLTGCSVLPQAESLQVYSLPEAQQGGTEQAGALAAQGWAVRVQTPYSSGVLNSRRIVVRPDHSELSVYKGVRWSDPAPVLLRDRVVDALRTQLPVLAFAHDAMNVVPDIELGSDLNRFQVEYQDGLPIVYVQLDAFLFNPKTAQVVASRRFAVEQPVDGKDVPEVVSAFGVATNTLAADIVAWVQRHAPNAPAEK